MRLCHIQGVDRFITRMNSVSKSLEDFVVTCSTSLQSEPAVCVWGGCIATPGPDSTEPGLLDPTSCCHGPNQKLGVAGQAPFHYVAMSTYYVAMSIYYVAMSICYVEMRIFCDSDSHIQASQLQLTYIHTYRSGCIGGRLEWLGAMLVLLGAREACYFTEAAASCSDHTNRPTTFTSNLQRGHSQGTKVLLPSTSLTMMVHARTSSGPAVKKYFKLRCA